MVFDTAKPKNRKSTIQPGMRGRDAARKLTLKVDILQVFTIDFSDPFYRESQLAIGWTEQKCKEWDELAKDIQTHSRGKEKIPRTTVSHLEQLRQKWAYETSTRFSSCCLSQKPSPPRVRRTNRRTHFSTTIQEMASFFKHIVVGHV